MKAFNIATIVILFLTLSTCKNPASKPVAEKPKTTDITATRKADIDTTSTFAIAGFRAALKKSFDFNTLNKAGQDTLDIVICGEYAYSPFGIIKDKSAFSSSLLKNFTVTNRTDSMDVGPFEFQILKYGSSKLIFFFDKDPEASKHSDIFKGEIYDADVSFLNGVKIGMSLGDFYAVFFDQFPTALKDKYHVILITSCVDDIIQTYTFRRDKLNSVIFKNDSYWKVDY
ncbi:hypothetical protein [Mucilaginibacter flavus]|uniref:hypothetical protein n=1 Tax=Mucilaginibacter flavus TaxID=931504 RepID=UPI0025B33DF8|nr:hypothetical protein [Mucilaginibacter flavus]MDN3581798.1 hypothetical protein [Mucilaginibacter flavus]